MKAEDLMVGDWVLLFDDKIAKVDCIGNTEVYLSDENGLDWQVTYEHIKPIPLTSEFLERNGFVYNELPFVQGWEQYGLTLTVGGSGFRVSCGQNVSMIIDSAHLLQHALRLCGIDKEIVL